MDEKQEQVFRRLFGKLRITYGVTTYTTEFDGVTETLPYQVLGRDKLSVVVREDWPKSFPLEVSEFGIIYFDGPDSYWLYTKFGGIQEYFKRIK